MRTLLSREVAISQQTLFYFKSMGQNVLLILSLQISLKGLLETNTNGKVCGFFLCLFVLFCFKIKQYCSNLSNCSKSVQCMTNSGLSKTFQKRSRDGGAVGGRRISISMQNCSLISREVLTSSCVQPYVGMW